MADLPVKPMSRILDAMHTAIVMIADEIIGYKLL